MTDTQSSATEVVVENGPEHTAPENIAPEHTTSESTVADEPVMQSPAAENAAGDANPPTVDQLEEEGDIAADYIEEFLDICDLDGDIDIDSRNGRAYLSVNSTEGTNLRLLSKPDTVNALQELTRLAVQNKTGSFSRLILDIAGSREARQAELGLLVDRAISRIEEGATQAALPPMSSYERKLVHDVVAERGYISASEGEGRERHTVITASA